MWYTLQDFYKSHEWTDFCAALKMQRINSDGDLICEHCHKSIVKKYDCIGHHKEALTLDNVNDVRISLNGDNVAFVHFKCHNDIHQRYGSYTRHVYLVYGSPLSGKSTFVKDNATIHDLVIDIDAIYNAISINPFHVKSGRLADNAFSVRDCLLENVKRKYGKWINAWIVSGMPYKGERERFCNDYGAEPIYIDCSKEEALTRLQEQGNSRDAKEYTKYIETWFTRYQE